MIRYGQEDAEYCKTSAQPWKNVILPDLHLEDYRDNGHGYFKKRIRMMCADECKEVHAQSGSEVTAIVTEFSHRPGNSQHFMQSSGCGHFPGRHSGGQWIPKPSTTKSPMIKNMTKGPAMTREEAVRALEVGIDGRRIERKRLPE